MGFKLGEIFYTIALKGTENFKKELNSTEEQTKTSSNGIENAFKKIGTAVITYFTVDKVIEFGRAITEAAAEVGAEASAFEQIMGHYSDVAQAKMERVADSTGVVASRLTPYMTSMTAKFKGLGYGIDEATNLASDGLTIASDAAAFWDKSLDESMSHLNSFINGSYEGGEAIGLFANDTQMAAYAVEQSIVKETKAWSKLDEATKQATRLEYAKLMFEQSGATGQAAKEADQYATVQANLSEKWRQFKAQIGEPVLQNIVIPTMNKLSDIVDVLSVGFENLNTWISENKELIKLLAAIVGGVIVSLTTFKLVTSGMSILNTLKSWVIGAKTAFMALNATLTANPIGLVISLIAGLVTAVLYLWSNCEWFRDGVLNMFETIKTSFEGLLTGVQTWWESFKAGALQSWNDFVTWITTGIQTFNDFINVKINEVSAFINNVSNAISTTISNIWNFITTWITNKINEIRSNVTNTFNIVETTIENIWNGIKNSTVNTWNAIKNAIMSPIETAKNFVGNMIDKIKSIMNFEWKLPHLKMPHVNISGEFSLLPPKVPHFSVDWYAKGGILEQPTIFGANGNRLMAGGEAGPEAVAPISELQKYLDNPNDEILKEILNALLKILTVIDDESRLYNLIVEAIEGSGFKVELDGREVGRIVKKYA